jgi:hypothetical protein
VTADVPWLDPARTLGDRCVLWSEAEMAAGVREVPPGSNTSPRIKQYFAPAYRRESGKLLGITAGPWCAVAACAAQRTCLLPGEKGAHGYYASGVELTAGCKLAGTWRDVGYEPKRGDLVILMRAGSGSDKASQSWERHVARVCNYLGDTVETIGGNEANAWGRQFITMGDPRICGWVEYP